MGEIERAKFVERAKRLENIIKESVEVERKQALVRKVVDALAADNDVAFDFNMYHGYAWAGIPVHVLIDDVRKAVTTLAEFLGGSVSKLEVYAGTPPHFKGKSDEITDQELLRRVALLEQNGFKTVYTVHIDDDGDVWGATLYVFLYDENDVKVVAPIEFTLE